MRGDALWIERIWAAVDTVLPDCRDRRRERCFRHLRVHPDYQGLRGLYVADGITDEDLAEKLRTIARECA